MTTPDTLAACQAYCEELKAELERVRGALAVEKEVTDVHVVTVNLFRAERTQLKTDLADCTNEIKRLSDLVDVGAHHVLLLLKKNKKQEGECDELHEHLDAAAVDNANLRLALTDERADHERIEEALKDEYHLLRATHAAELDEAVRFTLNYVRTYQSTHALSAWPLLTPDALIAAYRATRGHDNAPPDAGKEQE